MPLMTDAPAKQFETRIPARLDRLPWSRFHWLIVWALGVTWALDGLEVTLKGAISGVLQEPQVMNFSPAQIGFIASVYLAGAVIGALVFGYLTDRWGRKRLFFITLAVYLSGTLLTAFSWNLWTFCLFRFFTGSGIGGEYAAISSAIDELIPALYRGRVELIVNGSYWIGAAAGAASTLVLLDPRLLPPWLGWRIGFAIGALLGLFILCLRRHVPESPRWLMTHGRRAEAEQAIAEIERRVKDESGELPPPEEPPLLIHPRKSFGFGIVARTMFSKYPARSFLSLSLMISQAFLYNAVFFTYALILTRFYHVAPGRTGIYLLPFAAGNFLGPLLLGRFFDTIGRRQMISATYTLSAALLLVTGWAFSAGYLSSTTQTALWSVIFFFASAAASSAYLTVSEIFPLEIRALAIAFFYSLGTAAGGIAAPWLFGSLIGSGSREKIFFGYTAAAGLMFAAALIEILWGVKAERASLEQLASPLSTQE
ncbi:MAG TPA: MFS transporter [Candidatus Acidoferrales bacterium]|nr:MFS transporter [Candidatus Acidoferrales bacterium]